MIRVRKKMSYMSPPHIKLCLYTWKWMRYDLYCRTCGKDSYDSYKCGCQRRKMSTLYSGDWTSSVHCGVPQGSASGTFVFTLFAHPFVQVSHTFKNAAWMSSWQLYLFFLFDQCIRLASLLTRSSLKMWPNSFTLLWNSLWCLCDVCVFFGGLSSLIDHEWPWPCSHQHVDIMICCSA